MAMASAMQPMDPIMIQNHNKDLLPFNLPPKSRLGGWSEGRELTGKQRRARAATKRQRKARQRQAKQRQTILLHHSTLLFHATPKGVCKTLYL